MLYALLYIAFILPFTVWLGHELKRTYSLAHHWPWLLGAFATGVIGSVVSAAGGIWGNFLLHASGGVASTLLFVYLTRTLHLRFSWKLTTVLLFCFVSTLGVLNELAEFAVELLGWMTMSFDSQDTWRDFVANTTGAAIAWLGITIFWSVKPSGNKRH